MRTALNSTFKITKKSCGTVYLYPQHEMPIGVLQLLLPVLQLLGPLLLPLQLPDVVDGRLQDGAFVPAHVPENHRTVVMSASNGLLDLSISLSYVYSRGKNMIRGSRQTWGCCERSLADI